MTHTAQRVCVGCRTRRDVTQLQRVTSHEGDFVRGGPSAGRGAWVCSDTCFDRSVRDGSLNRALRLNHGVRR